MSFSIFIVVQTQKVYFKSPSLAGSRLTGFISGRRFSLGTRYWDDDDNNTFTFTRQIRTYATLLSVSVAFKAPIKALWVWICVVVFFPSARERTPSGWGHFGNCVWLQACLVNYEVHFQNRSMTLWGHAARNTGYIETTQCRTIKALQFQKYLAWKIEWRPSQRESWLSAGKMQVCPRWDLQQAHKHSCLHFFSSSIAKIKTLTGSNWALMNSSFLSTLWYWRTMRMNEGLQSV